MGSKGYEISLSLPSVRSTPWATPSGSQGNNQVKQEVVSPLQGGGWTHLKCPIEASKGQLDSTSQQDPEREGRNFSWIWRREVQRTVVRGWEQRVNMGHTMRFFKLEKTL